MKFLDRVLQQWRIRKALPFVRDGDRLLDVGCHDRTLIDALGDRLSQAVGVDGLIEPSEDGAVRLMRGIFPQEVDFDEGAFDCITALAVLEHVEEPEAFARACMHVLAPGGRVVLTVPHPNVDAILDLLIRLRLADGMAAEEHHGFELAETVPLFETAGLRLLHQDAFQLRLIGLNRLFVFEKPRESPQPSGGTSTRTPD